MRNIADYKPYKGFYDLREYALPKKIFRKLWDIQDYLNHVNERKNYFMKFEKNMWEKAKELSANYQQCLFSYSVQQSLSGSETKVSSPKLPSATSDKLKRWCKCLLFGNYREAL